MQKRINTLNYIQQKIVNFDYQDFFKSILWAIIIAIIFRTFLFEPFRIPSTSMVPTLMVGDYLFTSKYIYGYSKYAFPVPIPFIEGRYLFTSPERGDIIVFKGVQDPETYYIKRLVGLPGDSIQVKKGILFINDAAVEREHLGEYKKIGDSGETRLYSQYKETLPNGVSYNILDANIDNHTRFPDNTILYIVPEKHYFMMGDNRNHSKDSRFLSEFGYIPEDRLVGKAQFLFMTDDFKISNFLSDHNTGRAMKVIGHAD